MLLADIEGDLVGADGLGGEDRAVHDQVRPGRHEHAVLVARGLALGAVRDEHGAATAPRGHRPPLASHREPGATPPEQAACLERRDEVVPGGVARQRAEARQVGAHALGAHAGRGAGEKAGGLAVGHVYDAA